MAYFSFGSNMSSNFWNPSKVLMYSLRRYSGTSETALKSHLHAIIFSNIIYIEKRELMMDQCL